MMFFLLDIGPPLGGSTIGIAIALSAFFICAAVAYFVYKILKRSVKMAFRMIVVAIILLIGIVGSVVLMTIGGGGNARQPAKVSNNR